MDQPFRRVDGADEFASRTRAPHTLPHFATLERYGIVDTLDHAVTHTASEATSPAAGDTVDRLDALFREHYPRIARMVGRIVRDRGRAEEIAVDVFIKWRRHRAAHGDRAEGWLYRTAARQALDDWRRAERWLRIARVLAPLWPSPRTPEQLHAAEIERQQVRAVLAALKRRDAELLLLWTEDMTYEQMAAAIGVKPSSIGSLLRRAQAAFRIAYEEIHGQHS